MFVILRCSCGVVDRWPVWDGVFIATCKVCGQSGKFRVSGTGRE